MKISGKHYRAIWRGEDRTVRVIDQSRLPFAFEIRSLDSVRSAAQAIRDMVVRGAPLIGATAAFGVGLGVVVAVLDIRSDPPRAITWIPPALNNAACMIVL